MGAKRSLGPTGGKETPFSEARKFYSQEPELAFLAPNRLKRRPEMDTNGFYGDTFSSGFGDFYTAKRNGAGYGQGGSMGEPSYMARQAALMKPRLAKRRPEMDTNGFYGDTFSSGFGDFYTAKRASRLPSLPRDTLFA